MQIELYDQFGVIHFNVFDLFMHDHTVKSSESKNASVQCWYMHAFIFYADLIRYHTSSSNYQLSVAVYCYVHYYMVVSVAMLLSTIDLHYLCYCYYNYIMTAVSIALYMLTIINGIL